MEIITVVGITIMVVETMEEDKQLSLKRNQKM